MADLNVVGGELRDYSHYLLEWPADKDMGAVKTQATQEGCGEQGFTGLLEPLTLATRYLRDQAGKVCDIAMHRLRAMSDALVATADDYQHVDHENEKTINESGSERTAS